LDSALGKVKFERESKNGEIALEVVESNTNLFAGFEGNGPDIYVLAKALAPKELHCDLAKLIRTVRDVDEENAGTPQQPQIVLAHAKNKELLFLPIPKGQDPFEYACPVVESRGHDRDLRFLNRPNFPPKKANLFLGITHPAQT